MQQLTLDRIFAGLMVIVQGLAILFYGLFYRHVRPGDASAKKLGISSTMGLYPYFQDIHVMIFVGFGFLLTSFHRFRLSSLTNCFWVAALAVQYYFLFNAFWEGVIMGHFPEKIEINNTKLILGEVSAGAILIAVCAIVGKTNSLQYLIITIVGSCLYTLNEAIVVGKLGAKDIGGAMIIHAFGAFYGIGITSMYRYKESWGNKNLFETHDSLTSAMVGTLFLWCFWPSFNGALGTSDIEIHMATLNTYFSIIGSCVMAYVTSLMLGGGRFKMG